MLVILRLNLLKMLLFVAILNMVTGCKTVAPRETVIEKKKPIPFVKQSKVDPMSSIVASLLSKAHMAFKAGHYTTPSHDNAYDTFNSVLMVDPGNTQATSGLQAILLKYAELIRQSLSEGRLASASNYLERAELYYPANTLIMDLKKQIQTARYQAAQADKLPKVTSTPSEKEEPPEEIDLPRRPLDERSEEILTILTRVAQRLSESKESVLIYARSDKEGRWIYSQLKKAAKGYRVRGDIRVGRVTKLRILPPY